MLNLVHSDNVLLARRLWADRVNLISISVAEIESVINKADLLITRSDVKLNEKLLSKAHNLKWLGCVVSGSDHIDKAYLKRRKIPFYTAAGCNVTAVLDYVFSGLAYFDLWPKLLQKQLKVGIVGAGHVGGRLAQVLQQLQIQPLIFDPLVKKLHNCILADLTDCDIISLHPALTEEPQIEPSFGMIDDDFVSQLRPSSLLINAARGEILTPAAVAKLTTKALLTNTSSTVKTLMDTWLNEPNLNNQAIQNATLATGHIAGHSLDSKINGSLMVHAQLCEFFDKFILNRSIFNKSNVVNAEDFLPTKVLEFDNRKLDSLQALQQILLMHYPIDKESQQFKQQMLAADSIAESFKNYRKNYPALESVVVALKLN